MISLSSALMASPRAFAEGANLDLVLHPGSPAGGEAHHSRGRLTIYETRLRGRENRLHSVCWISYCWSHPRNEHVGRSNYNGVRTHTPLGQRTPTEFAKGFQFGEVSLE